MKRYVVGQDRSQSTLFPEVLDDYIAEDNPVRVVDVFVERPVGNDCYAEARYARCRILTKPAEQPFIAE